MITGISSIFRLAFEPLNLKPFALQIYMKHQTFFRVGFALVENEIAERIENVFSAILLEGLNPMRMCADDHIRARVNRRAGESNLRLMRIAGVFNSGVHRNDDKIAFAFQFFDGRFQRFEFFDAGDIIVFGNSAVVY